MRQGEVDGVNYHYISKEDFLLKEQNGFFGETTSYNVATEDIWYYGSAIEDYDKDKVMIVNPDGIKQISKIKSLNPIAFYIKANEDVIRQRLSIRGDNRKEADRRIEADDKDFFGIEKYVDYHAINNGKFTPLELAKAITGKYEFKEESLS